MLRQIHVVMRRCDTLAADFAGATALAALLLAGLYAPLLVRI